MARRDMGKLVFLDLVDRSGKIQLLVAEDRAGTVDLDLGDIVGVTGIPAKTKRGEPSLAVTELELLAKIRRPLPDTYHGVTETQTRYRQRYLDLLMSEDSRRDFEVRARMVASIRRLPRRPRLRRGRDTDPPAALRRRARRPVRHALERARPGPLPANRDRALPQAADRRRARARLRAGPRLPQRERVLQARARVHDGRVVRGLRGLRGHDAADRGARRDRRARDDRDDEGHVPRARGRPRRAVEARQARRAARRARALDARRGRAARAPRTSAASTRARTTRGASSSTTRSATSSSPT